MGRRGAAFLGLLALCAPAAWGAPPDLEARGVAVREAAEAEDTNRLGELAASDNPDPWLVADFLLATGQGAPALAFSRAAPREDVDALPAYVQGYVVPEGDTERRSALARAEDALAARDGDRALRLLASPSTEAGDVVSVRLLAARGEAFDLRRAYGESAAVHAEAAGRAEGLGWWTQASASLYLAALAHHRAGAYGEAVRVHRARLEIETRLDSAQGMGRTHFGLAKAYENLPGEDEPARAHRAEARKLAEASGDFEYVAKVLSDAARAAGARGALAEAVALAEEAGAALDRVAEPSPTARFDPDPVRITRDRCVLAMNAASWAVEGGDETRALALYADALTAAEATADPGLVAWAKAEVAARRGVMAQKGERYQEALDAFGVARTHYVDLGWSARAADMLRRTGVIHQLRREHRAALAAYEQAISELGALEAPGELALALMEAGSACTLLGRYPEAYDYLERALARARGLADKQIEANVLGRIGEHFEARFEYARALAYLEEALQAQAEAPTTGERGTLRFNLARVFLKMDNTDRALQAVEEAIADLSDGRKPAPLHQARLTRADVLVRRGQLEEAFAAYADLGPDTGTSEDRARLTAALLGMGDVRFLQGRYADALTHHRRALADLETRDPTPQAVLARNRVGRDLFFSGKTDEALSVLEQALTEAGDVHAPDAIALCLFNLAEAHLGLGRYTEAMTWSTRALDHIATFGLDLAESEGALARSGFASLPEFGAEAAWKSGDPGALFTFLERGRAATLVAGLGGREEVRRVTIPLRLREQEAAARAALAAAVGRYEDVRRRGLIGEEHNARRREAQEAAEALRGVMDAIRRTERMQADLTDPVVVGAEALRARLATRDAFVMYAPVRDRVIALVLTREEMWVCEIGSADEVRQAVEGLLLEDHPYVEPEGATKAGDLLIAPLGLPPSVARVLVSPAGALAYVPFSLFLEARDLAVVPSATALDLLAAAQAERGLRFLVLGNPDYAVRPDPSRLPPSLAVFREALGELPATEAEARAVGRHGPAVVRTGPEATETAFYAAIAGGERWRAVHFACHGLIDPENPVYSALALTADGEHDGFLTALEVFRLRMPADLVTLSGCETGKGRIVRGEGVLGLTRAFMQAGGARVLVSLWKVDDDATSALMQQFYDLWQPTDGTRPLPASTALRWAQDYVRHQERWAHPRYWAAWELWGLPE